MLRWNKGWCLDVIENGASMLLRAIFMCYRVCTENSALRCEWEWDVEVIENGIQVLLIMVLKCYEESTKQIFYWNLILVILVNIYREISNMGRWK